MISWFCVGCALGSMVVVVRAHDDVNKMKDARSKDLQIFGGAPIFSIKHQTSSDLLMNFRLCPQRLLNKKLIYSYLYFLTIIEHKRRAAQSCANEDPKGYSNGIIDENVL